MSGKRLKTAINIDAPPEVVWDILTDIKTYPEWNPMIRRAEGKIRVGARLKVRFQPEGSRGHTFRPRLTVVEPGHELRWLGWPRFPKLFDLDHYWLLEARGDGKTHLEHGSVMFGLIGSLLPQRIVDSSREPFEQMNRAMKQRAETKPQD